jgi:hypothetical protein
MAEVQKVSVVAKQQRQDYPTRLRALWDEGKASGPGQAFKLEKTLAAARARLKKLPAAEQTEVAQPPAVELVLEDIWLKIAA